MALFLVEMAIEGDSIENLRQSVSFITNEVYDEDQEKKLVVRAAELAQNVDEIVRFVKSTRILAMGNLVIQKFAERAKRKKVTLTTQDIRQLVKSLATLHWGDESQRDTQTFIAARQALAKVAPFRELATKHERKKLGDIVDLSFVGYLEDDHLKREDYFSRIGLPSVRIIPNQARLLSFCKQVDVTWFRNKMIVLWATTGKVQNFKEVMELVEALAKEPDFNTIAYAIINSTLSLISNDDMARLDMAIRAKQSQPDNFGLDQKVMLSEIYHRISLESSFEKKKK